MGVFCINISLNTRKISLSNMCVESRRLACKCNCTHAPVPAQVQTQQHTFTELLHSAAVAEQPPSSLRRSPFSFSPPPSLCASHFLSLSLALPQSCLFSTLSTAPASLSIAPGFFLLSVYLHGVDIYHHASRYLLLHFGYPEHLQ